MAEIVRRRPNSLRRDLGSPFWNLFEDFFGEVAGRSLLPKLWSEDGFLPAINVSEDKEKVTVTAEVPGMAKDDLEVSLDNGVLTLRGEKKEENVSDETNFHRVERRYGRFERRMRLPSYVDAEKTDASYKDGVLTLEIPKTASATVRSIEIR
ncbi:MAG: Hsp20/alpha crystallin family protein [Planctomycetes bacterium]|nr:Hsp20/alpha crystallin family protein [Planctomycetota bacterium]